MRLSPCNVTLLVIIVAYVSGCRTPSSGGDGPVQKISLELDNQDFATISDQLALSVVESGVLDKALQKPAVIAIGRIENHTRQPLDTDWLVISFRKSLHQSGKAIFTLTGTTNANWIVSGKIMESRVRTGSAVQITFSVSLSLADVQSKVILWTDEKQITKQGNKRDERSAHGL